MKGIDEHRRARLVRLIAVVAVLVGLVVLHSPLCVDSMSPATHAATSSEMTMTGHPDPVDDVPDPGGVLVTCLALVVTLLVAVTGLSQPGERIVLRRALVREIMSHGVMQVRSPRLAELSVLRI